MRRISTDKILRAYVIGIALGDGNLSNPNGRAVSLRITCDNKYPKLIKRIQNSVQKLLPDNKVSLVHRPKNCTDISCYSNYWEDLLGWKAEGGSKIIQKVTIPDWVMTDKKYRIASLKGLIETDGSIYFDRGYQAVMFTSAGRYLAKDVYEIISSLGFSPKMYKINRDLDKHSDSSRKVYKVRLSKEVSRFLNLVDPLKH